MLEDDNTVPQQTEQSAYHFHLSKMSRVCMFVAETCGKCTQLKSCFWCADDGTGVGRCYAEADSVARGKCVGKVSGYWQKTRCSESHVVVRNDENTERSVLVKLLLLLRKLRDSGNSDLLDNKLLSKSTTLNEDNAEVVIPPQPFKSIEYTPATTTTTTTITTITTDLIHASTSTHRDLSSSRSPSKERPGISTTLSPLNNNDTTSNLLNKLPNRTASFMKNVSYASNLTSHLALMNDTSKHLNNSHAAGRYHAPCLGMSRSTCLRHPVCSWCRENDTCCRWRPKNVKTKGAYSGHSNAVCPKASSCEECLSSDHRCYWCSAGSLCQTYPGESYVHLECSGKVSYKTCAQDVPVYVFALCIILVTFFLTVGYMCARKCYYFQLKPVEVKLEERPILFKKKNGRTVYQITESEEEDEEELFRNGKDAYTPSKVGLAPNNPAVW